MTTQRPDLHRLRAVVEEDTRAWVARAVIGLNLCPFAKAVQAKAQIHYAVSLADCAADLIEDLIAELNALSAIDAAARSTTLLIAPLCLTDFDEFNQFLDDADCTLIDQELDGVIQIASFHPNYRFAGTTASDITNFTNRSPYPLLHLLREEDIDRAVEAFPAAESIFERNMATLTRLGLAGWEALNVGASASTPNDATIATHPRRKRPQ